MTVNVSLCGSIPRSQMNFRSKKSSFDLSVNTSKCNNLNTSNLTMAVETSEKPCLPRQVSCEAIHTPAPPPIIEPPSWAVAARGDSKLEPVCESLNVQTPVDLTTQAVFRIGRSQNSDIQLLHCTSSRRHAILFHHPNGNCYIVDCGSAHGTFVNGKRVTTTMNQSISEGSSGMILPHRVKKGALIRFGGPGAPSFILKSFSVGLKSLMKDLEETKRKNICTFPNTTSTPIANQVSSDSDELSPDALVVLNTRLNAIGRSTGSRPLKRASQLCFQRDQLDSSSPTNIFLKKRSSVSFDEDIDFDEEVPCFKKRKIIVTTHENAPIPDFNHVSDVAIVSPSRQKPSLIFNFDDIERPVVSPTPIEDIQTPKILSGSDLSNRLKSILSPPLVLSSTKKNLRVSFSAEPTKIFYPPEITLDPSTDSEKS